MHGCVLAIDGVGAKHGGAATVLRAVVDAASRRKGVEQVVVFTSPGWAGRRLFPESDRLKLIEINSAESPVGRILWHSVGLARECKRANVCSLLCLSGGGRGGMNCRTTLFVQQSLPFSPEALRTLSAYGRIRMRVILWDLMWSARRCDAVVVQTPTMRRWVSEALGRPPAQIEVVVPDVQLPASHARSHELEEMRAVSERGRALLYVGNTSPYKNVAILSAAMVLLTRRVRDAVLFGTFPVGHPVLSTGSIRRLPELRGPVLTEAYGLATALVMPSLVETVGLPMLEAASQGTAVVVADRPYGHDICGDGALYFDPRDPHSLAEALESVLLDAELRRRVAAAGRSRVHALIDSKPYDRLVALAACSRGGGEP